MESNSHLYLKQEVAKEYEKKGYRTELEYRLDNGLIIDVVAINNQEKIFIEVGAMHGEDRIDKLEEYCDKVIHLPQIDKPKNRDDNFSTISFRRGFLEELEQYINNSHFSSKRFFLKHLALKEMENDKEYSEEEIKEIGKKLEKLGYMDR